MRVGTSLDNIKAAIDTISSQKVETVEFAGALYYLQNHPESKICRQYSQDRTIEIRMRPTLVEVIDGVESECAIGSDDLLADDWVILENKSELNRAINYRPKAGDLQR